VRLGAADQFALKPVPVLAGGGLVEAIPIDDQPQGIRPA